MTQSHGERLAKKREWYHKNIEKCRESAKKSRKKHKAKRNAENKEWVAKNTEKYRAYQKKYQQEWYQRNKEKKDAQNKEWAKQNPEKRKAISLRFKEGNPEAFQAYFKKYQETFLGKFRSLKGSAVKRNYSVDISFEQFVEIVSNPCTYCGEFEKRIGIDRVDNSLGYTKENSTPCCTTCNMMKKDMKLNDFLQHIQKIHNFTY